MTLIHYLLVPAIVVIFLLVMLAIIVSSSGPVVVGSELNADGTIEYLCLGRGCEDL